jgi:uncharacterized protein YbjT (DUF2867 family)
MFVVAGVTGNTGAIVADTLLAQKKPVRVIVRDEAKGAPWKAKGADVAVAALDDAKALTAALEGAQAAYLLSPPDLGGKDVIASRRALVDAIASAVEASGIPHVVFLSSVGAQHDEGTGIIRTVAYAEKRLSRTPAKLTFVRAASFLENFGPVAGATTQGVFPTFLPPDKVLPMVATRDIAETAAQALLKGPPSAKVDIIELSGSRDLSPRDVAALFAKIVGKPVELQAGPLEGVVPTYTSFGMSPDAAEQFRGMYAGIADGTVDWQGAPARAVRGKADPEEVLRSLLPKQS